jgi:hypothetical protein
MPLSARMTSPCEEARLAEFPAPLEHPARRTSASEMTGIEIVFMERCLSFELSEMIAKSYRSGIAGLSTPS